MLLKQGRGELIDLLYQTKCMTDSSTFAKTNIRVITLCYKVHCANIVWPILQSTASLPTMRRRSGAIVHLLVISLSTWMPTLRVQKLSCLFADEIG